MGTLGGPINFYWQSALEKWFPGWKMVRQKKDTAAMSSEEKQEFLEGGEGRIVEEEVRVRNWYNIFRKWFTDCITMGALLNTTLFLVVMGVLKGKTWTQIGIDLRTVCPFVFYNLCRTDSNYAIRKCGPSYGTRTRSGQSPTSSALPTVPSNDASSFSAVAV